MAARLFSFAALSIALLASFLYTPAAELYALRSIDRRATLTRYENNTAINNDKCIVHKEVNACEDVKIHFASSTAFIVCGDPEERVHFYPAAGNFDAASRREDSFREDLLKYDIRTKETTKLKIEGLEGDFITHGLDVYSFPEDSSKVLLFAVNHGRSGDSIVIFEHTLGSDTAQVLKEVRHAGIKTANGVAATGPTSFYITNDHFFTGGIMRWLEVTLGPWPWATDVQFCDFGGSNTTCRKVTDGHPGMNGIAISEDMKTLYVGDSQFGTMTIFDVLDDMSLEKTRSIKLGAAADNIRILPTSGDPIISIFPELEDLKYFLANVRELGSSVLVPSAALRLRKNRDYEPEVVFWDNGSALSFMTAGTIDPYNGVFIGGGVLQYGGFVVCDLPPAFVSGL